MALFWLLPLHCFAFRAGAGQIESFWNKGNPWSMLISVLNQFWDNTASSFLKTRLCQYISLIHFLLHAYTSRSAQATVGSSFPALCEWSPIFILYVPCVGCRLSPLQAQYMIMSKSVILLPVEIKTPLSVPFGLYRVTDPHIVNGKFCPLGSPSNIRPTCLDVLLQTSADEFWGENLATDCWDEIKQEICLIWPFS